MSFRKTSATKRTLAKLGAGVTIDKEVINSNFHVRFSDETNLRIRMFWGRWISAHQQLLSQEQNTSKKKTGKMSRAYLEIIDPPTSVVSFYSPWSDLQLHVLRGLSSSPESLIHPSIRLVGSEESALCLISCVTKDPPFRPHPCSLFGYDCSNGVCVVELSAENRHSLKLKDLFIKYPKIKDMQRALKLRQFIKIDPFKTRFSHLSNLSSFDHHAVRLCFQTILMDQKGHFTELLTPILSDPILNARCETIPVIDRLSNDSGSVVGGDQRMLLCDEVVPDDIAINFYEMRNGKVIWEALGEFQRNDVHGCGTCSISFQTPSYPNSCLTEPKIVFVQLKRPSSGVVSESVQFKYMPLSSKLGEFQYNKLMF